MNQGTIKCNEIKILLKIRLLQYRKKMKHVTVFRFDRNVRYYRHHTFRPTADTFDMLLCS